jgi:hypothetical protein
MITLRVCEGEKRNFLDKPSCLTDGHHSCRMFHLAMQLLAIRGWREVVIVPKIVSSTGESPRSARRRTRAARTLVRA